MPASLSTMAEQSSPCSAGIMPSSTEAVKIHHLVKAPENTPGSIRKRESWDADELATVYTTPECLPDGTI